MAHRSSIIVLAVAAATLLTAGAADAQSTRRAPAKAQAARTHRPVVIAEMSDATSRPLVIQKRSFLDPGNAVPVGQDTPANITYNTSGYRPVYTSYAPAFFGTSELPGRFDLPPTNPRFNPSSEPRIPLPFDE